MENSSKQTNSLHTHKPYKLYIVSFVSFICMCAAFGVYTYTYLSLSEFCRVRINQALSSPTAIHSHIYTILTHAWQFVDIKFVSRTGVNSIIRIFDSNKQWPLFILRPPEGWLNAIHRSVYICVCISVHTPGLSAILWFIRLLT